KVLAAAKAAESPIIGRQVPNFVAKDSAGQLHGLADYADKKAVVVVFLSTECPVANKYLPVIAELAKKQADQSVQWLAVYSSPSDDAAKIAAHFKEFEIKIPALYDQDQQILQSTGATRTAETFVLDGRRMVRYHGRIDDRF